MVDPFADENRISHPDSELLSTGTATISSGPEVKNSDIQIKIVVGLRQPSHDVLERKTHNSGNGADSICLGNGRVPNITADFSVKNGNDRSGENNHGELDDASGRDDMEDQSLLGIGHPDGQSCKDDPSVQNPENVPKLPQAGEGKINFPQHPADVLHYEDEPQPCLQQREGSSVDVTDSQCMEEVSSPPVSSAQFNIEKDTQPKQTVHALDWDENSSRSISSRQPRTKETGDQSDHGSASCEAAERLPPFVPTSGSKSVDQLFELVCETDSSAHCSMERDTQPKQKPVRSVHQGQGTSGQGTSLQLETREKSSYNLHASACPEESKSPLIQPEQSAASSIPTGYPRSTEELLNLRASSRLKKDTRTKQTSELPVYQDQVASGSSTSLASESKGTSSNRCQSEHGPTGNTAQGKLPLNKHGKPPQAVPSVPNDAETYSQSTIPSETNCTAVSSGQTNVSIGHETVRKRITISKRNLLRNTSSGMAVDDPNNLDQAQLSSLSDENSKSKVPVQLSGGSPGSLCQNQISTPASHADGSNHPQIQTQNIPEGVRLHESKQSFELVQASESDTQEHLETLHDAITVPSLNPSSNVDTIMEMVAQKASAVPIPREIDRERYEARQDVFCPMELDSSHLINVIIRPRLRPDEPEDISIFIPNPSLVWWPFFYQQETPQEVFLHQEDNDDDEPIEVPLRPNNYNPKAF